MSSFWSPDALDIDLAEFRVGSTPLGAPPSPADQFSAALIREDVYEPDGMGYAIGTRNGALDYVFVTLSEFQGRFLIAGKLIELPGSTSPAQVVDRFGEPYWTDRDDGEPILFYEYQGGGMELQFEFPDGKQLGYITLMRDGVLSKPEQRKSYGVTKPWPPEERGFLFGPG